MMKKLRAMVSVVVCVVIACAVTGCGTTAAVKLGGWDDARSAGGINYQQQRCQQYQAGPQEFCSTVRVVPAAGAAAFESGHNESILERTPNGLRSYNNYRNDGGSYTPAAGSPARGGYNQSGYVPDWTRVETLRSLPPYVEPEPAAPATKVQSDITVTVPPQPAK